MMSLSIQNLRSVQIQSVKNQTWISKRCYVAESFFSRLKGLIGTKKLREDEGLLLTRCRDIHMWWMSIPIDVVFIRKQEDSLYCITSVYSSVPPWRFLPLRDSNANECIELPVRTIERCSLQKGDLLCIDWL